MSNVQAPRMIYVAECGEYSDYHVVCAFESEEDATRAGVGDGVREMLLHPHAQHHIAEPRACLQVGRSSV